MQLKIEKELVEDKGLEQEKLLDEEIRVKNLEVDTPIRRGFEGGPGCLLY